MSVLPDGLSFIQRERARRIARVRNTAERIFTAYAAKNQLHDGSEAVALSRLAKRCFMAAEVFELEAEEQELAKL